MLFSILGRVVNDKDWCPKGGKTMEDFLSNVLTETLLLGFKNLNDLTLQVLAYLVVMRMMNKISK